MAESITEQTSLDDLEQIVIKLLELFVCEGVSEDKICIGINTLRVIMMRNQEALTEEQISYISNFKSYKSKRVATSGKSFLNTARDVVPEKLSKDL